MAKVGGKPPPAQGEAGITPGALKVEAMVWSSEGWLSLEAWCSLSLSLLYLTVEVGELGKVDAECAASVTYFIYF